MHPQLPASPALISRLLDVIEHDIVPLTQKGIARGNKCPLGLGTTVLQPIGSCPTPVQRPLGYLASLAKVDDATHPVPPR